MIKPYKDEAEFSKRLEASFKSLKVVGRGTVTVDVSEVQESKEFKRNLERAKNLVEGVSMITDIIEKIDQQFHSLNPVPVSDIRLTREEWKEIRDLLKKEVKEDAGPTGN